MDRKSTGVYSWLSKSELEELYGRRLQAGQNINRNDPTRFCVAPNRSVGIPNDSSMPLNAFNIDDSRTRKINPTPRQNPMVDLSSNQQRAMGNLGLVTPPVDVQSTHRSFYQENVGTINAPTMFPNQQSRVAASNPMYPPTRTSQDNLRPLFDYSPDEVNWSTYVPLIRNKPNVVGPIIPPRYWRTPVYNNPIINEETGFYHETEGVYRHFNTNSVNYYNYANRNNIGDQNDNNNNNNNNNNNENNII